MAVDLALDLGLGPAVLGQRGAQRLLRLAQPVDARQAPGPAGQRERAALEDDVETVREKTARRFAESAAVSSGAPTRKKPKTGKAY